MMGGAFLHAVSCLLGISTGHSQTTESERAALRNHSEGKRRGIEIGVYEGVTTCLIVEKMDRNGQLYSIDPFYRGRFGVCWGKLIAKNMIRRAGVGARVILLETYSHVAARRIDGQFDFIFVDGDHSLTGISRDWEDWSDRVSPGGIIALHDTVRPESGSHSSCLASVGFFDSTIFHDARFTLVEQVDTLSVLRRKE
jgi:predicted O-methyltransferase YrrM